MTTTNYVKEPFLNINKPLLYQGIGLNLVNYENYQLYEIAKSESTALSRDYIQEQTVKIGRISLIAAVQGLNNARALLLGSLYFLSNEAFKNTNFDNLNAAKDLLAWTFQTTGVIRAHSMFYHGVDANEKESLFNVGEKIYFRVDVETQQHSQWVPYNS